MKKAGLVGLAVTSLSTLSQIALVSAQQTNFDVVTQKSAEGISKIFSGAQLDPTQYTSIMLGILLWMVLYSVLKEIDLFKTKSGIWSGLFALVVTILAFWGFPPGFMEGILIQYQAMGATIVTLIPFIIMFYFTTTVTKNEMLAKTSWLVYIIYYFSLFVWKIGTQVNDEGELLKIFSLVNLPYFGAIIVGLIVLIFLSPIRKMIFKGKLDANTEDGKKKIQKASAGAEILGEAVDEFSEGGGI